MELMLIAVTVASLVVAAVMAAIAWRLARDERERSAARVAVLASAAAGPTFVTSREPAFDVRIDTTPEVEHDRTVFAAVAAPRHSGRQRVLALAAGALIVVLVAAGARMFATGPRTPLAPAGTADAAMEANSATAPLELLSLRHERNGNRLSVSGLVRNPQNGGRVDRLTAVVFLFDASGSFVTSARAPADFLRLSPGDETPFVVGLETPDNVARYRVSFRTDEGVVPHVDRREAR